MLQGLGSPVQVRGHPGWAGHVDTSYDARTHTDPVPPTEPAPAMYDAREQVLYWSDSTNEIAFVVPSGRESLDSEDRNDSIKSEVDGTCLSNRSEKGAGSCWDVSGGGGVSARRCGLVRVHCAGAGQGAGPGGAAGAANGVLADGALLAPRLLPATLRRAAIDAARRTRLNTDLYQPPHVRRRHLIQELAQQYKKDLTEPELLESLFRNP
ncbi:ral GTPase-activating protein subunit beta-like [Spodoptera litura]|uniref:Ral GTPase-activating protein subunit beta-like n=1 Tax=Spodoptera litura TaxID=69820 RepID=A0A9J7J3R7_SPOLT|nr:ral GTPase-activating protein subunit beta-like [Spodoptera litura]